MIENANWRAAIQITDSLRRYAEIAIYRNIGDGKYQFAKPDGSTEMLDEKQLMEGQEVEPMRFPIDILPALLGALSSHLGAVEHPQQLRRDYENERKRVDELMNTVMTIAKGQK